MQEVTRMNQDYFHEYLKLCDYELKNRLKKFMDDYEREDVPGTTFCK